MDVAHFFGGIGGSFSSGIAGLMKLALDILLGDARLAAGSAPVETSTSHWAPLSSFWKPTRPRSPENCRHTCGRGVFFKQRAPPPVGGDARG
jgi:hypothetical protein